MVATAWSENLRFPDLHQDIPSTVARSSVVAKNVQNNFHRFKFVYRDRRLLVSADLASCCGAGMEGWNRGRRSAWSGYSRDTVGSNVSSSRSGTIVSNLSTACASSGSRFSVEAAAMHFDSLGIHRDSNTWSWWKAEEEDRRDRIRSLVLEFFGAPSASCSVKRGDMSVVERWLKELGVGWVLSLQEGASARHDAWTWIQALYQITQTLCLTRPLFPDGSVGLTGIRVPYRYHLVLFVQETMSKVLTFVDVLVAWDPDKMGYSSMDHAMYTKLIYLFPVHDALSEASNKIVTLFDSSPTSVEVERIENEMVILLSAYKSKVSEVIRSTMEKFRMLLMEDGDDSSSCRNPNGSSDIHNVTRSVMTYIEFLNDTRRSVDHLTHHVPCTETIQLLDNMIVQMVSSLQEKLVNISESFSDQGLKLLFLLNNSNRFRWKLQYYDLRGPELLDVKHEIEGYMERYLQISWAPLLSFLCNSTPLCLGKNYSLLSKFESEFHKICTTQMEWKVPDPELRRKLRQAISDKIIPGYTEYIEDNKVTRPKISPQELEAKLQELFEG